MTGRLQSAEDKGEVASLGLDPALLEQAEIGKAQACVRVVGHTSRTGSARAIQ